ncbi:MAG: glycosyl transferase, partial [Sedimentibacter sp.]
MTTYVQILIMGIVLVACIFIFVKFVLMKLRNNGKINIRDALLSGEKLEDYAKKTAIEHSISNKQKFLNWPVPRMNENYDFILLVYKELNEEIQKKDVVPPAAEWLLDNFYIIEEQVKILRRDLVKKSYMRLPVLKTGLLKGYARIHAIALELATHTDGQIDERVLSAYLKAYQSHKILYDREIWAIPMVLRLALIENIRYLCENIRDTQFQWNKADEIFDSWKSSECVSTEYVMKLFSESLRSKDGTNPSFVEHLFYLLRKSGHSYVEFLRVMDQSLEKLGTTTEQITQEEHYLQSANTVSIGNCISSMRFISTFDWSDLFDSASFIEQILELDPEGTYAAMNNSSRNYYRSSIEKLASTYEVSEIHIAREAVELAKQAYSNSDSSSSVDAEIQRKCHVGYYIIGKGINSLEISLGKKHKKINKLHEILYFSSIFLITLFFALLAVYYSIVTSSSNAISIYIIAFIAVLIPSSEIAVNLVNLTVSKTVKPSFFPSLELKDGIPESLSTIVVIPTLLPTENRVKEIVRRLENHYLSNREENLFFAIIGAFADSDNSPMGKNDDIIEAALNGVKALNQKYCKNGQDKFYFFHRDSQFNEKNNKWIGWERKRGALMEFNDFVLGSFDTSFSYASCNEPPFSNVKYIITLDSDTIMPMGVVKKMIGTMAHPLNQPIIDRKRGIVTEGYGLMQPKVDFDSESSNKSLLSRIFTGQEGLDPYANAISNVYQDLFDEGIYMGKGIYDLKVFQSVLKNSIPENSVLSHDLLEGSYVRAGLVNDLRLVDSYPSKFNSYSSRLHRWVRGDWQLIPFLYGKVFNGNNKSMANPISKLSRWKMFDNLRRSLVAPSLIVLVALSFS